MATVQAYIRTTKKKADDVNIRFRLSAGRGVQLYHVSEITVSPDKWNEQKQEIKSRALVADSYRREINTAVADRKRLLMDVYNTIKDEPTSERWYAEIDKRLKPEAYQPKEKTFFDIFDEFMKVKSDRKVYLKVLERCLKRWQMYRQATENKSFEIDINTLTDKDIRSFDKFLQVEYLIQDNFPEIYKAVPETRRVEPRGNNARSNHLQQFRAFYNWSNLTGKTINNPFKHFEVPQERYGTPYYLTIEELNTLLHTDMTPFPETATQRDIFVFQCLIGCRVSDLTKLTKANLKDGGNFIEYIPQKTINKRPLTVRVPLTETAKNLISKYDGVDKHGRLFPFISDQKYNVQIKKMFRIANLDRMVTVLNPTNGNEEQRSLCEVASSHLARRTFIGNLYDEVRDPNLIGSMTGHVDGSRAFARYRNINDKVKMDTVKRLEL